MLLKFFFIGVIIASGVHVESFIVSKSAADDDLFPVAIIHFNDFHARFEETNEQSISCGEGETCIGGYARVVTMVKELKERHSEKNPIYLNVGDNFQGTLWYNLLKWNVTSHFLNLLPADAMTIGNHEFDHGIEGIVPFLAAVKDFTPIVVSNIDDSEEPTMQGLYQKSVVIDKYARKIGVIGTIWSLTHEISKSEKLKFLDEVTNIQIEVDKMKAAGVNIIIVLSHCGLDVDRQIAKDLGGEIDIIVGGHSHTFMFTGDNPPGPDTPRADYPEIVKADDGNEVLIVQASAYTKYLGDIVLYFDNDGKIVKHEGAPIFLGSDVIPDPDTVQELLPYKEEVDKISKVVVGESLVLLDKGQCNYGDCNIGNLVADSFTHWYAMKPLSEGDKGWTQATIALSNVGGIRTTLSAKDLNYGDIKSVIPFDNTLDLIELKGEDLWESVEYSVTKSWDEDRFNGANLLEVSGLRIVANVTKPIGQRVVSIDALCRVCDVPEYQPLNKTEVYKMIVTSFLVDGGDGFVLFRDKKLSHEVGDLDIDAFEDYIRRKSPIIAAVDGRLKILT